MCWLRLLNEIISTLVSGYLNKDEEQCLTFLVSTHLAFPIYRSLFDIFSSIHVVFFSSSMILFFSRALSSGACLFFRSSFYRYICAMRTLFRYSIQLCDFIDVCSIGVAIAVALTDCVSLISRPFTDLLFVFMHTLRWVECISNINK